MSRLVALLVAVAITSLPGPGRTEGTNPAPTGAPSYSSPRTLSVGIRIDRDVARIVGHAVHDRPFVAPESAASPRAVTAGTEPQVELTLIGPSGARFVRRVDAESICLLHGGDEGPHVEGDTIVLHRDTFVAELPDLPGFDTIELATYRDGEGSLERTILGTATLPGIRPGTSIVETSGTVHWPEEYGDPERYTVYGNEAETSRRINLVIVPDGYVREEKARMQAHAQALVAFLRSKTPFAEHDAFINYVLVYAYSNQSGTDQCDCDIVVDTAMNTRFPDHGYSCGNSANRCLSYGTGGAGTTCDPSTSDVNIVAAELRAPAVDETFIMVNTTRYGGCGGARATYAGGHASATEIAAHEMGHAFPRLSDEYGGYTSCGSGSTINTSTNATDGAWPEWIPTIGAPREGARTYDRCVFRPEGNCRMRALGIPFCRVCNQAWALSIFGHARVVPTAPVASQEPVSPVHVEYGESVAFSVATRLASGAGVTNTLTWTLSGPGLPPTIVATGTTTYARTFDTAGTYTLTCEVVADTNFVRPQKTGANRDVATWTIDACRPLGDPCSRHADCCEGRCRGRRCR